MKTLDYTKLDKNAVEPVIAGLQQLLADYQVFYTNLRGLHWNIKGNKFFILHAQYEEMYDNAAEKVDEIAERILMLNGVPAHNFSTYLKTSKVKESEYISESDAGLSLVLDTFGHLISTERDILDTASKAGDESTVAMMSDYISEQEKLVWMLVAYKS